MFIGRLSTAEDYIYILDCIEKEKSACKYSRVDNFLAAHASKCRCANYETGDSKLRSRFDDFRLWQMRFVN